MDSLPVELLTPICFLACTDGGPTACSLSLVSRHIHAVCRPARFHSVAFSGPRVLTAVPHFLARLKEEHEDRKRAEAASRVRHLFVSVLPPLAESQTMVWKVYVFTVTTLLRAVASDVETLSLVFSPWGPGRTKPIELDVAFPRLSELTVSGASFSAPQLGSAPAFPALRRLHLVSGPCSHEWTSLTPNVTHLRLSELPDLAANPEISLKELQLITCPEPESLWLPTPTPEESETPDNPTHYPNLQQIIVQPSCFPLFRGHGFYKGFIRWLWVSQPVSRVPMYLIPPDRGIDVDQRAKQERCSVKVRGLWLAGVEGSLCSWEPDEKYAHLTRSRGDEMPLYLTPWLEESPGSETPSGVSEGNGAGIRDQRNSSTSASTSTVPPGIWRRSGPRATWLHNSSIPAPQALEDMEAMQREVERL
ncbi:hypothetical protein GSI_14128 [Ganoderma sinense ZZ0214-1]|uniref:F-box domain-containing protein n=1 Tax=Ganoderma sinense ZZ0214-1 TaxID=1077348 RepID=A0A2G8RS82_9APHY|nr:hypothetical protein GSI_14128 [Ganoderma sinense ZZ0214-1]